MQYDFDMMGLPFNSHIPLRLPYTRLWTLKAYQRVMYQCNVGALVCILCMKWLAHTHIKSRVEAAPEVELFPYILDNTRECAGLCMSQGKIFTHKEGEREGEGGHNTNLVFCILYLCILLVNAQSLLYLNILWLLAVKHTSIICDAVDSWWTIIHFPENTK